MPPKAKYGVYAYKCAGLIGLENVCPELAVLIERDTGITQVDYSNYDLPVSNKSIEVRAVIYIFKYADYFHKKGLEDKLEDYFKVCDKFVYFVRDKTGISVKELMEEVYKHTSN